jgi:hypothetical protein
MVDNVIQLKLPLRWYDDVRAWGNPHLKPPKSDAVYFGEDTYTLMRDVIGAEFSRTYALWRQNKIQAHTNDEELLEVAALEIEAKKLNIKDVQIYIAVRIGCSQQRVSLLLQLISIDRMTDEYGNFWYTGSNLPFIGDGEEIQWSPPQEMIRKKKLAIPRICAGGFNNCSGDSTNGKVPMCFNCHTHALRNYGSSFDYPEWLQSEIRRIETEHYAAARDACYKDRYGTLSLDEVEFYLDAS